MWDDASHWAWQQMQNIRIDAMCVCRCSVFSPTRYQIECHSLLRFKLILRIAEVKFRTCSYVLYSKYSNRENDHKKLMAVNSIPWSLCFWIDRVAFVIEHKYTAAFITFSFLSNGKNGKIIYFNKFFFVMRWDDLLMCILLCSYFRQLISMTPMIFLSCVMCEFLYSFQHRERVREYKGKTFRANAHQHAHAPNMDQIVHTW